MRKHLLFLAAGALALTACTSEEILDETTSSRNVIKFENAVNKHTRADLTSSTLNHFNVFGFYTKAATGGEGEVTDLVFYNTPVKFVDSTTGWVYYDKNTDQTFQRHWTDGAKYYFYAYSCGNQDISEETSYGIGYNMDMANRKFEILNYQCDDNHQHDLVFAYKNGIDPLTNNASVSLQF